MNSIHHIEIVVSELGRSSEFYKRLLLALGWKELRAGMYLKDGCEIYLRAGADGTRGFPMGPHHICFRAASREDVDRVGEVLRADAATIIRGPMTMPAYGPTYYTVDFRDPDGFVLEVAHE